MPTKEYRVIIDGEIVDRSYTKLGHDLAVFYYESRGDKFETEIIKLI